VTFRKGDRVAWDSDPAYTGTVIDVAYVVQWDSDEWETEFVSRFAIRREGPLSPINVTPSYPNDSTAYYAYVQGVREVLEALTGDEVKIEIMIDGIRMEATVQANESSL